MTREMCTDMSVDKSVDMSTGTALSRGGPMDGGEPVFREPWEAQAFALVVSLRRQGLFTWPEWTAALAAKIKAAQVGGDADLGDTYYRHWLAALEGLVASKEISSAVELKCCQLAWEQAAHRTRHGEPIELREADFSPGGAAQTMFSSSSRSHR